LLRRNLNTGEYHFQRLEVSRTNTNNIISTTYRLSIFEKELPKNGYTTPIIFTNSFTTFEEPRKKVDKKEKWVYAAISGAAGFIIGVIIRSIPN